MQSQKTIWHSGFIVALSLCFATGAFAHGRTDKVSPSYPYATTGTFASFVTESFRTAGVKDPKQEAQTFYTYMGNEIPASMDTIKPLLAKETNKTIRTQAEREVCFNLHRDIKKQIPKFSLDRGFEFYNTVKLGERQCYLQSVIIASLLQRAGIPAGVAMVSRNDKGAYCNNGHAVVVARLSDGNDILVDASDPAPFMTHQSLMVNVPKSGHYAYVDPIYNAENIITGYHNRQNGKTLRPSGVALLDVAFLRSQFDYYRGERTPGGLFTPPLAKPAGLAQSEKWLQKSVTECPQNPLAMYMLGKIQEREGKLASARTAYTNAYALYSRYGWIPKEETRCLANIKQKTARVAIVP